MNKVFLRYFISGYLNRFNANQLVYSEISSAKRKSIRTLQVYLELPDKYVPLLNILAPVLPICDMVISLVRVFFKFILCVIRLIPSHHQSIPSGYFFVQLNMLPGKVNNMNKVVPEIEKTYLEIPFIKNQMTGGVNILPYLNVVDLWESMLLSVRTIIFLYWKYSKNYQMFRAHSSFEFYLTCMFVRKTPNDRSFVFYSLIDRWAYLFANDSKHSNILIQHGILGDVPFIKMKAPHKVYYVNKEQKQILDKRLFRIPPMESLYRPMLQFSGDEKLLKNDREDILLVCCPKFTEQERSIIDSICKTNRYNLYVKTHPGFSNNDIYDELQSKYGFILLDKYDYPKVDFVISYNSTLAIEYMDVGMVVYKYDDADFNRKFNQLLK